MKNLIFSLILATTTLISAAQSEKDYQNNRIPEFLGIEVDGKRDEVINKFKTKGFKVEGDINKSNVATMKGIVSGMEFELNIVSTPKSKIVWKYSIYLPEETSWYTLKTRFYDYLDILIKKYGEPEKKYEFFSSPYKEGDGYEMTGVASGNSHFSAYWSDEKGISISISKWKQVNISYENQKNSKLADKEKSEIDSSIF